MRFLSLGRSSPSRLQGSSQDCQAARQAAPEGEVGGVKPVSDAHEKSQAAAPPASVTKGGVALAEPYPWILNPTIDLLFCCGGLFWIIYAVFVATGSKADLFGSPAAFGLMATSIIGLHIIGDPHQPATIFRVYCSPSTRKALGKPVAIVGVFALAAGLLVLFANSTTAFFLKLVLAWGIQHQLSQSYGIALVYCFKRKYFLNKRERQVMFAMIWAMIIYLVLRILTLKDFGSWKINGFAVPFTPYGPEWLPGVALIGVQISVLAFAVMVVRKYIKEKRLFPLPGLLTLMTLIMMPFLCGTQFFIVWYLFSTTFFHSAQYLCVTSTFYFKERGLPENVPVYKIAEMLKTPVFAKYFAIVFGAGFLVSYLLPCFMTDHGIAKPIAFASIYVAVNLHHFVTDMFIWKLRDPVLQKLLVA